MFSMFTSDDQSETTDTTTTPDTLTTTTTTKSATAMSTIEFNSLSECLEKYIEGDELKEVKKILFGRDDE